MRFILDTLGEIMKVEKVIILARKHAGNGAAMESSARVCLADAVALFDAGKYDDAKNRALDSLRYSVGILHADYKRAAGQTRPAYAWE